MSENPNAAQITYWNELGGRTWAELNDRLDRQIEGVGRAAIEALDPKPGERVLDVGCGGGQTTLLLAERVGPSGAVVGADISRPMLELAWARGEGLANVRFEQADAQVEDFGAGAFDGIFSRFGVMFFADPKAAFSNLRRALKPGGRLAFACWRSPAENPLMTAPMAAAARHLPPAASPPPDPTAPGPFAFADPERVRGILEGAGFRDVGLRALDLPLGGNSLEEALTLALRIGPLGARLREQPELAPLVSADVREALARHLKDGKVWLPGAVWIVTAGAP